MKYSLKLCSVLLFGMASASAQETFFIHFDSLQDGHDGRGQSVVEISDGYLVFMQQISQDTTISSRNHIHVQKLGFNGTVLWSNEVNAGQDRDHFISFSDLDPVCTTFEGDFVSSVTDIDLNTWYSSMNGLWLYRFNDQGDTISTKLLLQYPLTDSVQIGGQQTIQTPDSGFAIVGGINTPSLGSRVFLLRTTKYGDTLWMRTFDVTNTAGGVALNADGGFLVTGRTNAQVNAYFMIRTDPQGNTYWRRDFGAYPKSTQQVRLAADGNILTWATHNTTWAPGVQDTVNSRLSCWSQNNTLLWFKDIGSIWYPTTNDFEVLQDGSVITGGSWNYMFRLIKFGPQGDSLWTSAYILLGGPCILADVEGTSDGGYIATGWAMQTLAHGDPTPGIPTTIVLKLDSMGCLIPGCQNVGVHEQVLDLQDALSVFPNPSAGPFVLELTLPSSLELLGTLQAVVVDAVGREVYRQGHGTQLQQRFTVDLSGNPPGLYYLHITDGQRALTGAKLMKE